LSDSSTIAAAFDGEAASYDARFSDHPSARAMRQASWSVYADYLTPGDRVLDLNCGTGADFPFFAEQGACLSGLDCSPHMLAVAKERGLKARLWQMDFNDLDALETTYHLICSNFGGLNTQPFFDKFSASCWRKLEPGGYLIVNVMTQWPLAEILEGLLRGRHLFRRRRHGGCLSLNVGGEMVDTWYFRPLPFYGQFAEHFELVKLVGLGALLPPPYLNPRRLFGFRFLHLLERMLARRFPFNRLGDHTMLVMRARDETKMRRPQTKPAGRMC